MENLLLRKQIEILMRRQKRPRVNNRDRIRIVLISRVYSLWQNGYAEHVIGSIRRECLDHVIILNEKHLQSILQSYFDYYHHSRIHLGLNKDTPILQVNHPSGNGPIRSIPLVGGLHHRYERFEA